MSVQTRPVAYSQYDRLPDFGILTGFRQWFILVDAASMYKTQLKTSENIQVSRSSSLFYNTSGDVHTQEKKFQCDFYITSRFRPLEKGVQYNLGSTA